MNESPYKIETLCEKIRNLTLEICCFKEAMEFVQLNSDSIQGEIAEKLMSGALWMLVSQAKKMSADAIAVELLMSNIMRESGEPA